MNQKAKPADIRNQNKEIRTTRQSQSQQSATHLAVSGKRHMI